jgi:hypothetical protein
VKMSDFFATSPQRNSFWADMYRQKVAKDPDNSEMQKTLKFYEQVADRDAAPSGEDINMEDDLRSSRWISDKCKFSQAYAQNLYAALCNNFFSKGGKVWRCSWRHAGGVVANLCEGGDYIDWYCSGMVEGDGFVCEGTITEEIRSDLSSMGWSPPS